MRKLPALSEKVAADPAKAMRAAGFDPEAARYELRDSDGRSAMRGLGMVVQKSGHRTWVLRYEIASKPYKLTLGPYTSDLKLAAARDIASKRKLEIANGKNPAAEKAEARRKTAAGIDPDALFTTAWGEWEKAPKPKSRDHKSWRPSTADRVQKLYVNELEPKWGKRRLSEISKTDVSGYLDKIAVKHPQAAARRLRVIASFFNWCVAKGRLQGSPCDGIEMAKTRKRQHKLTDDELRWLWKACVKLAFPMGHIVRLLSPYGFINTCEAPSRTALKPLRPPRVPARTEARRVL